MSPTERRSPGFPGEVRQIAERKMVDLNANDIDNAMRIIEGTARSMGVEVDGVSAQPGKRYRQAIETFDREQEYLPADAIEILKSLPDAKFDETVEIAFRLGIDTRKNEQALRGTVALPGRDRQDASASPCSRRGKGPRSPRGGSRRRRR